MKVGDLVKDFDGYIGIIMTTPRPSLALGGERHGDIYDVVDALMPLGIELFAIDELEVVSIGTSEHEGR